MHLSNHILVGLNTWHCLGLNLPFGQENETLHWSFRHQQPGWICLGAGQVTLGIQGGGSQQLGLAQDFCFLPLLPPPQSLLPHIWALSSLAEPVYSCHVASQEAPESSLFQGITCSPWHILPFEMPISLSPASFGLCSLITPLVKCPSPTLWWRNYLAQQFSNFLVSAPTYTLKNY